MMYIELVSSALENNEIWAFLNKDNRYNIYEMNFVLFWETDLKASL